MVRTVRPRTQANGITVANPQKQIKKDGFVIERLRVPFELLSQSPSSETLTLKVKASELQKIKALPKTEQPRSVRQSDLAKLYQQYKTLPAIQCRAFPVEKRAKG
jgi:hypothetical protein